MAKTPTGYHSGYSYGHDHGIRLRADLKLPVLGCNVCGHDHTVEEGEEPEEEE